MGVDRYRVGRSQTKRAENAMEDAGFGDTHNDLRSAASQLSGVGTVFVTCQARAQTRIPSATAMRTGSPLSITSSRMRNDRSRSKTSNSSTTFFLSANCS